MTTPTTQASPDDAREQERGVGALRKLFTFEEVDDAIELLERLASVREEEDAETGAGLQGANAGLRINVPIHTVIGQLRTVRRFHAIPEAALGAAYAAAGHPLEDEGDE